MKKLLLLLIFIVFSVTIQAQSDTHTYQIIYPTKGYSNITLTQSHLTKIQSLRTDETRYFYITDDVIVKILPNGEQSTKAILYMDEMRENITETYNIQNL